MNEEIKKSEEQSNKNEDGTKIPFEAKCKRCGQTGWIAREGYPNGDILKRLFIKFSQETFCERCLD